MKAGPSAWSVGAPFRAFMLGGLLVSALATFGCSSAKPAPAQAPLDSTVQGAGSAAPPGEPAAVAAAPGPDARPEQALAKVPVTSADPQWGSVDAPVTIVEISDFQCPFCARVQPTLEQLKAKYGPTKLRLVYKHNPLPFHKDARPAAEAAAAVFMLRGSEAFFQFHGLAFANQQALTGENFALWATRAGVGATDLQAWLDSGRARQKVEDDMRIAKQVGASGTPAFRINGVVVSGAQPLEKFVEVVDAQLEAARQLTQAGTPPRLVYVTLTDKNFVDPAPQPTAKPEPEEDHAVWNIPVLADDPQRGPKDALVTLVEFSEYQCPFCKRVEATLEELRRIYGKDLRMVWKDNPLPFHPRAMPTAKLGRAVFQTKGNDAFWKLHDALFESQPKLEDSDLEELLKKQGLAWKPLQTLSESKKIAQRIEESMETASDFEARGTPHFFINGRRLSGAQPVSAFQKLIDEELAKARALVEHGTPRAKVYAELLRDAKNPPAPERKTALAPAKSASRGLPQAPVVIQIFSDFQCPFCKRVEPTLKELEAEMPTSLRIVWRHLPLPFHQYAQLAAEAAEEVLAQKGPVAFWKYHDMLFEAQGEQDGLERVNLLKLADELGCDMARFQAALDNHTHQAKVQEDSEAASKLGINGTPAFLINDFYVSGAQPLSVFRRTVKRALSERKKP
ncbi:MAG TPA: thioredoxin domain-containing protein [Polyangiaceae bacterium]|nr:thioredoxin domain-containing protein [Polyangiaceae bacterium]